jgi:hypothetical protein
MSNSLDPHDAEYAPMSAGRGQPASGRAPLADPDKDTAAETAGVDPFVAMQFIDAELSKVTAAIDALSTGTDVASSTLLRALACVAVGTDFPGDRREADVERMIRQIQNNSQRGSSDSSFFLPREVLSKDGGMAAKMLGMHKRTLAAALVGIEALTSADEPLPPIGNLHPVHYARRVNKRGVEFFRGRIPGMAI